MKPTQAQIEYLKEEVKQQEEALIRRAKAQDVDNDEIEVPVYAMLTPDSVTYSRKLNKITEVKFFIEGCNNVQKIKL